MTLTSSMSSSTDRNVLVNGNASANSNTHSDGNANNNTNANTESNKVTAKAKSNTVQAKVNAGPNDPPAHFGTYHDQTSLSSCAAAAPAPAAVRFLVTDFRFICFFITYGYFSISTWLPLRILDQRSLVTKYLDNCAPSHSPPPK